MNPLELQFLIAISQSPDTVEMSSLVQTPPAVEPGRRPLGGHTLPVHWPADAVERRAAAAGAAR
jgi:hypothetical protein